MNQDDVVKKSYRSILIAWVTAASWCIALHKPWIGLSITLGTLLGTGILASFDWLVRKVFVPGARTPNRALLKMALVKYPLIGLAFYWLVRWERINLMAFCGGVVLVHFALLCKVIGIRYIQRTEEPSPSIGAASTKES